MRVVMFYHSLRSDWNHGNAHFLRGVASELIARGHDVTVYEPADSWSATNLAVEGGIAALDGFRRVYPKLNFRLYDLAALDLDAVLDDADLVIVHEWSAHALVARIGMHRARNPGYVLLFHDTHHRAVTEPESMASYDLRHYDGVLAYGRTIQQIYIDRGWAAQAFVWHEAADTRVFHPRPGEKQGDVVWIGNWGDDERTAELREFLIQPVSKLKLDAVIHGVRYPEHARAELKQAGMTYRGWLPNYEAPHVFSRYRATVHVPRRPYVRALPGIPTIRVFEALACGIPLISAPWDDTEGLFAPGEDFLVARNGAEMCARLRDVMNDDALARALAERGLATIAARHTCAHRVSELLAIVNALRPIAASRSREGNARVMGLSA